MSLEKLEARKLQLIHELDQEAESINRDKAAGVDVATRENDLTKKRTAYENVGSVITNTVNELNAPHYVIENTLDGDWVAVDDEGGMEARPYICGWTNKFKFANKAEAEQARLKMMQEQPERYTTPIDLTIELASSWDKTIAKSRADRGLPVLED